MTSSLSVTEDQVLWYRARRGFLVDGANHLPEAAQAVLGFQAQQEAPALLGLSRRTKGRPTATEILTLLQDAPRRLVRTWGQRDTLHMYDISDWFEIVAARPLWSAGGRRGPMPTESETALCLETVLTQDEPFTKQVLEDKVTDRFVEALREFAEPYNMDPHRLAMTRMLWLLARDGEVCIAGKSGTERLYARRGAWFPDLIWPDTFDAEESAEALARRYLHHYGPATPADIAHFFKAKVSSVKRWIKRFEHDLVGVACGDRKGLLLLEKDVADLTVEPPGHPNDWPAVLLPMWDGLLMGHKDKSWISPNEADRKKVWRAGAFVAATMLVRGRIVATWTQKAKTHRLDVEIKPLSGWLKEYGPAAEAEAQAAAHHLGLTEVRLKGL